MSENAPRHASVRVIETPDVREAGGQVDMPERFTNQLGMTFVRIPAGTFWMGTSANEIAALLSRNRSATWIRQEAPQHQVTISRPFYLGIHPVTQGQWEAVMGSNPSRFKGDRDRPVESVSWSDVKQFLERLRHVDGRAYTLPSEAQWEYACRAGSTRAYCFGYEESRLSDYAWYIENSGRTTHPVGQKQPNAWGLYDMHGNVLEWVDDWYGDYPSGVMTDPTGPNTGASRVRRGGHWGSTAQVVRAAFRRAFPPDLRDTDTGFRCLTSGREPD